MQSELLPAIAAFAKVARLASFTRASAELGVSASALSQTVRALEKRVGVRLLERSTRHVGLTETGRHLLEQAAPALASLQAAIDGLDEARERPAGTLRLNISQTAAEITLLPHLADFADAYPDITVELQCDNALVDLVAGGFDAGIRLGENLSDGMVAVPLGRRMHMATVAAPRYLQGRSLPRSPEDLRGHRCIQVRLPSGAYRWEYAHKGREFDIETQGPLVANDGAVLLGAARAGVGIACAMEAQVEEDIAAGRLVPLLRPWWPSFPGFYLYHPNRTHMPRKLRAFIDFMRSRNQG